jgi:hypothetical protein
MVKRRSATLNEALDVPRARSFKELKVGISDGKHSLNKPRGGLAMSQRHAEQARNRPVGVVAAVRERDMVQANYLPGRLRIHHGSFVPRQRGGSILGNLLFDI